MKQVTNNAKDFEQVLLLIQEARSRVFAKANAELVLLYFNVGNIVSHKVAAGNWGENTVQELADFIASKQPQLSGFNRRGLYRMKHGPVPGAVHPRGHHRVGGGLAGGDVLGPHPCRIAPAGDALARIRSAGTGVGHLRDRGLVQGVVDGSGVEESVLDQRRETVLCPVGVDDGHHFRGDRDRRQRGSADRCWRRRWSGRRGALAEDEAATEDRQGRGHAEGIQTLQGTIFHWFNSDGARYRVGQTANRPSRDRNMIGPVRVLIRGCGDRE